MLISTFTNSQKPDPKSYGRLCFSGLDLTFVHFVIQLTFFLKKIIILGLQRSVRHCRTSKSLKLVVFKMTWLHQSHFLLDKTVGVLILQHL